jgi:hypothetical protein
MGQPLMITYGNTPQQATMPATPGPVFGAVQPGAGAYAGMNGFQSY